MKGNQGLEALAALCGGASKAQVPSTAPTATQQSNKGAQRCEKTTTSVTDTSSSNSTAASTPSSLGAIPVTQVSQDSVPSARQAQVVPQAQPNHPVQQWQTVVPQYSHIPTAAETTAAAHAILQAAAAQNTVNFPIQASATVDPNYYAYYHAYSQAAAQAQTNTPGVVIGADGKPSIMGQTTAPVAYVNPGVALYSIAGQPTAHVHVPHRDTANNRQNSQVNHVPTQIQEVRPPVKQIIPAPIAAAQVSSSVPTTSSPGAMPPPAQNAANVAQSQAYILPGQRSISHPVTNVVPNVKHPQPDIASPAEETEPQDPDEKKKQKRAANRRSAQLSRKRKKQFIEELKEENDELRRKELILKSIPDLIVVFDSSGKIWFVSDSVNGFLDMTSEELEGTSFWDRLCPESVRLLKAAFMDALAARKSHMATTPLGSGVWELRLVDTEGKQSVITLNGVVHFSSERDSPECVCSIRPRDASSSVGAKRQRGIPVIAHQSVISKQGYVAAADETSHAAPRKAAQISDGDSGGSVISEGGSEP